jgi:hypothetical protein
MSLVGWLQSLRNPSFREEDDALMTDDNHDLAVALEQADAAAAGIEKLRSTSLAVAGFVL